MKLPILLYYLCVYTVKYSVSLEEGSGSSEYIKDTIAEKNPVLISEHEKEIISFAEHTTENLKELNKDFVVVNVDATTQSTTTTTTTNNNYQEKINSSTTILIRDTPSEDTSLPANLNTTGNDPFQNTPTTTIATLIKKISLPANVETTKDDDPFQSASGLITNTHAIISKIISDEEKTGNDPFEKVSPVEAAASLPADVEEKIKVVIDPTQSVSSNIPPNNSMPYGNVITPSPPANANPLNNSTINLKSPTSNDTAPTTLPADVEKTKDDLFENAPATRISNDKKTESDPFQNTLTTTEHAIISTWLPMATTTTTTTSKEQNGESFSNLFHLNDSQKINFVEPTTADPTQSVSSPPSNSTPYGNAINIVDPFQNSTINLKSLTTNDTDEHMRNSTTFSNLAISSQSESTPVVEITTATFGETATTAIATTTAKEASLQNKTLYLGAKKTHVNQTYSNIVEVRNHHDNVTQFSSDIRDANITNNKCAQLLAIGSNKDICDLVEVFMSNDVNVENFYDLLNNVIKRTALDLYNVYHFMILAFLFCANIIEILLIFILRKLYLCIMKRKRITLW